MDLPKIYQDKDADLNLIQSEKVGIIGFGNQGRAQALNLRDSGVEVLIGLRRAKFQASYGSAQDAKLYSDSWKIAKAEGFTCVSIEEAVQTTAIISLLIPDQVMGKVFAEKIVPNLREGQTILFSHGYNVYYKLIKPPENVDVIMAAPSGAGTELRNRYLDG